MTGLLVIECIAAPDGVPVAPCGTVGGQPLAPVVRQLDGPPTIDAQLHGQAFSWGLSLVAIVFVVGLTVGSIMRVIRSA